MYRQTRLAERVAYHAKPAATMRAIANFFLLLTVTAVSITALGKSATPGAIVNLTTRDGGSGCVPCHGNTGGGISVSLGGNRALTRGQSATYTVTASLGSNTIDKKMGVAIAVDALAGNPPLVTLSGSAPLQYQSASQELIHDSSTAALHKTNASGVANYTFTYSMPLNAGFGSTRKLYATSRINDGVIDANKWAHAVDSTNSANNYITITTITPAPVINSSATKSGKVGVALSYQTTVTTGNAIQPPTSFSATGRPAGIGINTSTGVLTGVPTTATNGTPVQTTITANNDGGSDTQIVAFTIAKGDQTLSFSTPPSQVFSPGGTFTLTGSTSPASAPSPLFQSTTPAVCTKGLGVGTTVTIVAAGPGPCTIVATQPGDSNWNAAPVLASHTKNITISKANQTINFGLQAPKPFVLNGTISLTPGSATSGSALTYTSLTPLVCTTPGTTSTTVTMLDNGTCTIEASQGGNGNYFPASPNVQQDTLLTELPVAPTMGTRYAGDARATILFGAGLNGASITKYTATCSAIGQTTRTGTSTTPTSPIVVISMVNGITYSCHVTATNSFGTGPQSPSGSVTPDLPPPNVVPIIVSGTAIPFKVGVANTFNVVSVGTPNATIATSGVALPAGLIYTTSTKFPGLVFISGTPLPGTVGSYLLGMQASNVAGTSALQKPTLTVSKGDQSITFPDPVDREYSPTPFALAATSSSGLSVSYVVGLPSIGICSVSGANVTMLAPGVCTIVASRASDASFNAAPNVQQSFVISPASQTITFGSNAPVTFSAGGTFLLNPAASASSGYPVSYASLSTTICTISGTTVSILAGGICTIEASQDGNALYLPAADVPQNITIQPGAQTITFPSQAARPFVEAGAFAISPIATATSGLAIAYSSTTPAICSVTPNGTQVTMLAVGSCNITASQPGDTNYVAATPVNATIAINAVPPAPPTLSAIAASDGTARVFVTASADTGGAPIIGFRVTCNPGSVIVAGPTSPVTVSGLANGVLHTCSAEARNGAGFSAASNALTVTPFLDTGTNLWTNTCSGCHGAIPAGARFNAAGDLSTVLQYVRANQASMLADSGVQALTANELAEIAKYIKLQVPAIDVATTYQSPVQIDVGYPNHITLNTVSFTSVEAVTPPANGTLSTFSGTVVTYTPNAGFAGADSFTYRGKRTSPSSLLGEARTVTLMVAIPSPPVITSLATANGVYGQTLNYQITATNSPASFGASGLGAGSTVNPTTGLISGTPLATGVFNVTVAATNPGGTGMQIVQVTVSPANQTLVSFNAQAGQSFAPGGSFAISPLATFTSGLTPIYTSLSLGVCSVSGTTVTMVTAGTCTVAANQSGNANFNAALQATQTVNIAAVAPGAPIIGAAFAGDGQASISFTPPANNGGSPITQYNASCAPSGNGNNTVSPITVTMLTNGTPYTCSVTATSAGGTSVALGSVMVTPQNTPVAPQITSANATTFTVLSNNTFTVTASGVPAPTLSLFAGTPPAGVNFGGGSVLSGIPASGTAAASPYVLTFRATDPSAANLPVNQSFTLTVAKTSQSISFTNPGARSFSLTPFALAGSASSSLALTYTSNTPVVCTVALANVTTLTTGVCSISADQPGNGDYNAATQVTQGFSINAASQTITFGAQTSPRNFALGSSFPISPLPAASSALPVSVNSATPGVCSVIGSTTVNMISAGQCTLVAIQTGNQNFSLATPVPQSITINAIAPGTPVIGVASGSDAQVTINFTPPAGNGGSAITQYTATCNPGNKTGTALSSPVIVAGLTNGTPYTCSVTATNAAAFTGLASGNVMVTPTSADGAALWTAVCDVCHTSTPSGNQLNGAGSTAVVLNHVRSLQPLMVGFAPVQNLSQAELASIAAYIANNLPQNQVATAQNTAVPIDVSGHVTFTNQAWSAFTAVEVATPPVNGMLSAFTGTTATYTPNPGFSGADTFTYRGKRTAPNLTGDAVQVTVNVQVGAPSITSPGTANGTFGQAFIYQITATGSPTSFAATALPLGLTIDTNTGAITGTAQAAGAFTASMSATNAGGTASVPLQITIAQAAQTITFGAQIPAAQTFQTGGTFAINPTATGGGSGNSVVYSSKTSTICSVANSLVTILQAGICTIAADQLGNSDYLAAAEVPRNVIINPVVPGVPSIGSAIPGNTQAQVAFTAPSFTGGSPIIDYTVTCFGDLTRTGAATGSPVTVLNLTNGISYSCTATARNLAGNSAASVAVNVTPALVLPPGAPSIVLATPGDASASIDFNAPVSNGGASINQYRVTCNPGNITAFGNASPIAISGLSNGQQYDCSVAATNSAGTGAESATLQVTPVSAINLVAVQSRKSHTGFGSFDFALDPLPSISGAIKVEPRGGASSHLIVFQFDSVVSQIGVVTVEDRFGAPLNGVASAVRNGNDVFVTLIGIPDNTRVKVNLPGVNGVLNTSVSVGFLVGDVSGSRSVNASDIATVKTRNGLAINVGNNYVYDLNTNGSINASDVSAVKARSGLVLP